MSILALEGIVEHGLIRLPSDVKLLDRTRVFVIVPTRKTRQEARIISPRLTHPEQARDFAMEVSKEEGDAGL